MYRRSIKNDRDKRSKSYDQLPLSGATSPTANAISNTIGSTSMVISRESKNSMIFGSLRQSPHLSSNSLNSQDWSESNLSTLTSDDYSDTVSEQSYKSYAGSDFSQKTRDWPTIYTDSSSVFKDFRGKVEETKRKLDHLLGFIYRYECTATNISIKNSMKNLVDDIRHARKRIEYLETVNVREYRGSRDLDTLKQDLLDTIEVLGMIYRKRWVDILLSLSTSDILENYYQETLKNKEIRQEFVRNFNSHRLVSDIYSPYFSQISASAKFKTTTNGNTASSEILGKSIEEVAEYIQQSDVSDEILKICVFRYNGKWVSENNRGLAAAALAGVKLTRVSVVFPKHIHIGYFEEKLNSPAFKKCKNYEEKDTYLRSLGLEVPNSGKQTIYAIVTVPLTWGTKDTVAIAAHDPIHNCALAPSVPKEENTSSVSEEMVLSEVEVISSSVWPSKKVGHNSGIVSAKRRRHSIFSNPSNTISESFDSSRRSFELPKVNTNSSSHLAARARADVRNALTTLDTLPSITRSKSK